MYKHLISVYYNYNKANGEMLIAKTTCHIIYALLLTLLTLGACATYEPPFTHYLTPKMDFPSVQNIASQHGYETYQKVAEHKGFSLLNFEKNGGTDHVYLIIDPQRKPVLRTVSYGKIDKEELVNFVDDIIRHRSKNQTSPATS